MGSIAKICHQHHVTVNIIMSSDAMALAAVASLNTKQVYDTFVKSQDNGWMFANRVPHILNNEYKAVHSVVTIILKILELSKTMPKR